MLIIGNENYIFGNINVETCKMSIEFGEKIALLIKERNMTQKELAKRVQITEATLSRYMNGEREPKSEVVANLATALHTTTDYLLGVENEDEEFSYPRVSRILARNVNSYSTEQKNKLVKLLLNLK